MVNNVDGGMPVEMGFSLHWSAQVRVIRVSQSVHDDSGHGEEIGNNNSYPDRM